MIRYNFTSGLLKNFGIGGSKYDLVPFGNTPLFDAVDGCFEVGTSNGVYLRTNVVAGGDNTLLTGDELYFRIVCNVSALGGSIWGTVITSGAYPIRAYVDASNVYLNGGASVPNAKIVNIGMNDLVYKINTITSEVEIKNLITGASGKTTSAGITKADMINRDLYLGCANYSGSANYGMPSMNLYKVYFGYDESAILDEYVCYLKKDGIYHSFNNNTGEITAVGNKITAAMLAVATKATLPADIVDINGYDMAIFSAEEFQTYQDVKLNTNDVKTEVYVSDVDAASYLDKDGVLADIGKSYGIPLGEYSLDGSKDIILRVPKTSRLKFPVEFINSGNDFVCEANTCGPDIGVRGYLGVKNTAIYGHSKIDSISVGKESSLQPTFTGLIDKSRVEVLGEISLKTRIENSSVEVTGTRAIDGIEDAMKVSYDVYSSLVEVAEDEDMFNDSYVIDGSGTGVSNITVNVGNFIEIKLPDDITDVIYPEFMSYHLSKLKGVPQKSGNYTIRFKMDGKEVTSKLTVVGVTRIK